MGNEISGVGASEDEHPDGWVGLDLLNKGDQIRNQFRPQKVHGRGRYFHKHSGPLLVYGERFERHGILLVRCRRSLTYAAIGSPREPLRKRASAVPRPRSGRLSPPGCSGSVWVMPVPP